MKAFIVAVRKFIDENELIVGGEKICVALSGGPDSVALLHLLHTLQKPLSFFVVACHVNYGYREGAGEDAQFCQDLCATLKIPFRRFENSRPKPDSGLQEKARNIRYHFFEELRAEHFCHSIATGHTLNDSVETSLLWMIRGTGPGAFGGMRARREHYIRPLLQTTKKELLHWLADEKIDYRIDESNSTDEYRRNRIRRQVIPLLEEESPGALMAIARLATLCRSEDDFLYDMAAARVAQWQTDCSSLLIPVDEVAAEPVAMRYALYRAACAGIGLDAHALTLERVRAMDNLLNARLPGKKIELPEGFVAFYDQTGFSLHPPRKESPLEPIAVTFPLVLSTTAGTLTLGEGDILFDVTLLPPEAVIRGRQQGDRLQLHGAGGHKSLKNFFIDKKVSFHLRDQWPLIAHGHNVLYVAGLYLNPTLAPSEELLSSQNNRQIKWQQKTDSPQIAGQ